MGDRGMPDAGLQISVALGAAHQFHKSVHSMSSTMPCRSISRRCTGCTHREVALRQAHPVP